MDESRMPRCREVETKATEPACFDTRVEALHTQPELAYFDPAGIRVRAYEIIRQLIGRR